MSDPRDRQPPPSLSAMRPGQAPGPQLRSSDGLSAYPNPGPAGYQSRRPPQNFRDDEPPRRGFGLIRVVAMAVFGLVIIGVSGVGFLLLSPPAGIVRDRLIAEVKQKTGRDLVIKGSVRLSMLPSVSVSLGDVTLSAPPSMPGPPLIKAEQLNLQLELLPLITRQIVVDSLILRRPTVELRIDAEGRRNWDFAEAEDLRRPGAMRYAQVNPRGPDGKPIPKELQEFVRNSGDGAPGKRKLAGINDISLGVVRVIDGTIRYVDAKAPAPVTISSIDGHMTLKELAGPLATAGSITYGTVPVTFDIRVQSLKDLIEDQPTRITVKLGAKPVDAGYDGLFTGGSTPNLDGKLTVKAQSIDQLARFLQVPLAGLDPLGALTIDGQIKFAGQNIGLSAASVALGETSAVGSISVATGGSRPQVKANLKFAALDLNRFAGLEPTFAPPLAAPPEKPAVDPRDAPANIPRVGRFAPPVGTPLAPQPAPQTNPRPEPKAKSIEELLARPELEAPPQTKLGPAVRGFTKRTNEGWSSEPLNASPLRLFDLDGRFEFGKLAWANVQLGATQAAVQLKSGILKLDIPQVDLFGGRAKALINLDARAPELTIGANISGDGIVTLALMQAISDVDFLDGRGRLVLAVSAKGGSERELIGTLNGRADLKLVDGALLGWDASQLIGGLGQGRVPKLERVPGARTPFSEVSGTFQISNGVARNQDLKVESPSVRANGSGVINLVDRNINMLIKPQASSGSIEIPLRIAGPLDNVSVVPDLNGALKSPQAQEAMKKLKEGDVEGAARDVLGGGPKADAKIGKAKEMLKQFLNR